VSLPRYELVTAPTVEPITLAELKAHAKIDGDHEDAALEAFIVAARQMVEKHTGRALITQEWRASLSAWPDVYENSKHRQVRLCAHPVQSIDAVTVDGTALAASAYRLRGKELLVSTESPDSQGELDDEIVIEFTAGYGDTAADVPGDLLTAVKMLATHLHTVRGATSPQGIYHQVVPMGVSALLAHYIVLDL